MKTTAHKINIRPAGFLLVVCSNQGHRVGLVRANYRMGDALEELGFPRDTPVNQETMEWLEQRLNGTSTSGQSSRSSSGSRRTYTKKKG